MRVCMRVCVYACMYMYVSRPRPRPRTRTRSPIPTPVVIGLPASSPSISCWPRQAAAHKSNNSSSYPRVTLAPPQKKGAAEATPVGYKLFILVRPPLARPKTQLLVCGPARCGFVPAISLRK